jgi:hypothetical protein
MNYLVSWEIEIKARGPIEAAMLAREAQIQPNTRSTVFQVYAENSTDDPSWWI